MPGRSRAAGGDQRCSERPGLGERMSPLPLGWGVRGRPVTYLRSQSQREIVSSLYAETLETEH